MPWWEIIGWTGSALVVISLIIPSIRRFRMLNLAGSLIATVYNIAFGIWPYAAMNAVITVIDAYWLYRLRSGTREYRFVRLAPDSPLVADFLACHGADIAQAFPQFAKRYQNATGAYLTMNKDEIAGIFLYEDCAGRGSVLADYVTQRYRDLTPGLAFYNDAKVCAELPFSLSIEREATTDPAYFEKMGFEASDDVLTLKVHCVA